MVEAAFRTKHNLQFENARWEVGEIFRGDILFQKFRIGTVEGAWGVDKENYYILALQNHELNNGHFDDVLEWFENSCKRDKRNLVVCDLWNEALKLHFIRKRKFSLCKEGVKKKFKH
jgi:hypothetical protein